MGLPKFFCWTRRRTSKGTLLQPWAYRDGSRRSHDFLRSICAIGTTAISSPYSISNCGRALRDGLRFPLPGDRRFVAAGKRDSFSNRAQKIALPWFKEYCWGYPFNWVTRNGTIKEQTPLITTTPYCYEAFLQVFELTAQDEWKVIVESIARHAAADIKDFRTSEKCKQFFLHSFR